MKALITGSCGLVGSACAVYLANNGFDIVGVDDDHRAAFFGEKASTAPTKQFLKDTLGSRYESYRLDIRERDRLGAVVYAECPKLIVHCAAQPSHDLAAKIPFEDFEVNAVGTLNLLEAARQYCPEAPFVFMSTNKVYGDAPNRWEFEERDKRYEYDRRHEYANRTFGVNEREDTDQCLHSLFGASKLAADILVQEYGRYFGMPTVCLRAGCLTGPQHAGVELHGFLSYLIDCNVKEREYKVFGYKGKQVRDNLHAEDVAKFALEFYKAPRKAAVYNIGGGFPNSCSILEAFDAAYEFTGKRMKYTYVDEPRIGDHICYYSDLRKIKADYPGWSVTHDLPSIFAEIAGSKMKTTGVDPWLQTR
jgi:CDP-paratose 2-epimerase